MDVLPFRQPAAPASPPGDPTVAEVVGRYLEHLRCRVLLGTYAAHTLDDTARALGNFAAHFGGQRVDQCLKADLGAWLVRNPQWRSNHTRKRCVASVVAAFSWAEENLRTPHPYRRPRLELVTEPRRPMEAAEYVAVMRRASRALRRALFFLRRTGARTCEMRKLTWPMVSWEAGVAVLDEHKTRRKSRAPRYIPLEPAVLRLLANLHRRRPPGSTHVFLNCDGQPWKTAQVFARHFRRWADRLGLPKDVSPYCVRHAFTVAALEGGLGERQVADALGQADTRMVSWYGRGTRAKTDHLKRVAADVARRRPRERRGD